MSNYQVFQNFRILQRNFVFFFSIVTITSIIIMLISLKVWSKTSNINLNIFEDEMISENISIVKRHIIRKGDTFSSILSEIGISNNEIADVSDKLKKIYNLKRLSIGQPIAIIFEQDNEGKAIIKSIKFDSDVDRQIEVARNNKNEIYAKETRKELEKKLVHLGEYIKHSLIGTANNAGVPNNITKDLIDAYSYDIDFQRDIKDGDKFEILFEAFVNENNEIVKSGNIIYASLNLGPNSHNIYYHTTANGSSGFYDEEGKSIKKALLKTPVNGARISSSYGMRKHPILGYSKMHKGIDFAAPKGTPIYAAGNGTISEIGPKGSYGNYVKIKHNNNYFTAYAHISRFAKGVKKGQKVKQGQIIAYVGNSGRATGPHLHYEVLKNSQHVNPNKVKQLPGQKLNNSELANFKKHKVRVERMLASIPSETNIASID